MYICIEFLNVYWKGYFRRGEVEAASELYDEAIISYTRALRLEPHNTKLMESIKNITKIQQNKIKSKCINYMLTFYS